MKTPLRKIIRSDTILSLLVAIVWQIAMTVLLSRLRPDPAGIEPLYHMTQWDGGWYLAILKDWYTTNPAAAAFYPLFPFAIYLLQIVTFSVIPLPTLALLLNTICLWLALTAIIKITRHFVKKKAQLSILFLLASPAAFFLSLFYSEALFMAIAFWAYLFALRKNWLAMGILLGLLTANRLPSVLFIALCGLEFLRAYEWDPRKFFNKNILFFLLAPLGFIIYGCYLFVARGNFLAMFSAYHATNDWTYHAFEPNILIVIGESLYEVLQVLQQDRVLDAGIIANYLAPLLCLFILLTTSLFLIVKVKGKGIPLGISVLLSFLLFTLNSNLVSIHRYILPCLGIYIALTVAYVKFKRIRVAIISILLMMITAQVLLLLLKPFDYFVG